MPNALFLFVAIFAAATCWPGLTVVAQDADVAAGPNPQAAPTAAGARSGRGGFTLNVAPTLAAQMLAQADQNADQKLTMDEWMGLAATWFKMLDSDETGRVSQEDFIERFANTVPPPPGFVPRGGGVPGGGRGGFWSSRFVGFFLALDEDKDASLTRVELQRTFEKWFSEWDRDKTGSIDSEKLIAGLNSALPRTNMGGALGGEAQTPIPGLPKPPPSAVLPAADSMKTVQLAEGFALELCASEPMIEEPIAISFDEDGRLFVVEMRGFMLDIDRTGERQPLGRISLLEDRDEDGRFDKATVFVDHLILPRAIAAVNGGILYVSDYKLWFARDSDGDGKADHTELVDAAYGSGNVEHGPNGLMRAMDNWIYNAESPFRYRFVGGVLLKQRTEFRGQWGMTQDNYGRLFYNVNNSQLLGDLAPPNYMGRNPHHRTSAGLNLAVATDQRVFTLRMNTAINRGYLTNVLDPSGKLYVFSSSCSPVIYRGDNYPEEFRGNAFVCDPSANLIKRNLVFDQNLTLTSKFAYDDREFLASTDERFRPVNAYNGPDGTLWIADMYRGVIQYGMFMTSYLRRESLERGLDKGTHLGRIYRIVSKTKRPAKLPHLSRENSAALVKRLSDPSGWRRDTAQRLLVERRDLSVVPELLEVISHSANPLGRIHALWTLEGLFLTVPQGMIPNDAVGTSTKLMSLAEAETNLVLPPASLRPDVLALCVRAMDDSDVKVQSAAIRVAEALSAGSEADQKFLLGELTRLKRRSPEAVFQIALTAGNLPKPDSLPILAATATTEGGQSLIRHAILSGLRNWELQFLQILLADPRWQNQQPGRGSMLQALASAIANERDSKKVETLVVLAATQKSQQSWRRKSLLDGLAAAAQNRSGQPINLHAPPVALEIIGKSEDPTVTNQVERIKTLFSWPGHPNERGPAATPATAHRLDGEAAAAGKLLFEQICAGCHGLAGEGLTPLAPPLANSSWVTGPESRLIRIALHGASGPIVVNGTRYEPPQSLPDMPSLREALDDKQIAAVLSYVRQELGNAGSAISTEQVAKIRKETASRDTPWTEDELLKIK